jgi:N utilization substance protein A
VVVLDESKRQALAVVPEGQLSLAIGKQGLNVRLANRLVDWSIDVKTQAQFSEMDLTAETKRAVSALFGELPEEADEITRIAELPEIPQHIVAMLEAAGHEYIEDLVNLTDEELETIEGLSADDVSTLKRIIAESVEIIETEEAAQAEYEDEAEYEEEAEYDEEDAETDEADETEQAELPEGEAATEVAEPEIETIEEEEEEEITLISELPNIDERVVEILNKAGIEDILDLLDMPENKLRKLEGITEDDVAAIQQIISDNVEIIEEDEDNTEA